MKLVRILLVLLVSLALSGCFSGGGEDWEPVTVKGAFGSVDLPEKPKRIVALDTQLIDSLVAIDEQPVALAADTGASEADFLLRSPWLKGTYTGKYDQSLTGGANYDVDAIASYKPDLIVASGLVIDEKGYKALSKVAPTYIQPGLQDAGWKDVIAAQRSIGRLTGKSAQAEEQIKKTQAKIDDAKARTPGLQGKRYANIVEDADGDLVVVTEGRWRLLGLRPAKVHKTATTKAIEEPKISDLSDADVIFSYPESSKLDDTRKFRALPAVASNTVVPIDQGLSDAGTWGTGPLGIGWMIDRVLPQLEESELNEN